MLFQDISSIFRGSPPERALVTLIGNLFTTAHSLTRSLTHSLTHSLIALLLVDLGRWQGRTSVSE
jgi:hypothetical protein